MAQILRYGSRHDSMQGSLSGMHAPPRPVKITNTCGAQWFQSIEVRKAITTKDPIWSYNDLPHSQINQWIYVLFCPAPRIFTPASPREPNAHLRVLKMCLLMLCSKLSSTFKGPRAAKTIKRQRIDNCTQKSHSCLRLYFWVWLLDRKNAKINKNDTQGTRKEI